jgi:hypothetical protein
MLNKYIINIMLVSSLILGITSPYGYPIKSDLDSTIGKEQVYINDSAYTMDKNLIDMGYGLQTEDKNLVFLYQNKKVSAARFYAPSIAPNKAIKLFISLKKTIRNAKIYLNDNELNQKTDDSGKALIDVYEEKGKYHLALTNNNKSSLNYFFALDEDVALECSGVTSLSCQKKPY